MEKLKIHTPTAHDLGEAFGITEKRMNEISDLLDAMVKRATSGEIRLVYAVDIYNHIRGICDTDEEYTWAIHNHMMWLARTGRLFTTAEVQKEAIKKYGQPKNL